MAILLAESADGGRTWSEWRNVPMPEEIGPPEPDQPAPPAGRWPPGAERGDQQDLRGPIKVVAAGRVLPLHRRRAHVDRTGHSRLRSNRPYFQLGSARRGCAGWPDRCVRVDVRQRQLPLPRHPPASQPRWRIHVVAREPLGFADQPSRPAILPDGRVVLAWVDRFGSRSIRARLATDVEAPFDPASEVVIYQHASGSPGGVEISDTAGLLGDMQLWSFGLPFAEVLPGRGCACRPLRRDARRHGHSLGAAETLTLCFSMISRQLSAISLQQSAFSDQMGSISRTLLLLIADG